MLRPQPALRGVEIDQVAVAHVDRRDADPGLAGIEAIEIDQALERRLQRGGVVEAGRGITGEGREEGRRKARLNRINFGKCMISYSQRNNYLIL